MSPRPIAMAPPLRWNCALQTKIPTFEVFGAFLTAARGSSKAQYKKELAQDDLKHCQLLPRSSLSTGDLLRNRMLIREIKSFESLTDVLKYTTLYTEAHVVERQR